MIRKIPILIALIFMLGFAACDETAQKDLKKENSVSDCESQNTFENIMGYSGYFEDDIQEGFMIRTYYAVHDTDPADQAGAFAESFGYNIDVYVVDIDGDGISELLSNSTYCVDSHEELYVFRRAEAGTGADKERVSAVQVGYVNWSKLDLPDFYNWGSNAISTRYDSDKNCIIIKYCSNESAETAETAQAVETDETAQTAETAETAPGTNCTVKTIEAGFEILEYTNWNGIDYPAVEWE